MPPGRRRRPAPAARVDAPLPKSPPPKNSVGKQAATQKAKKLVSHCLQKLIGSKRMIFRSVCVSVHLFFFPSGRDYWPAANLLYVSREGEPTVRPTLCDYRSRSQLLQPASNWQVQMVNQVGEALLTNHVQGRVVWEAITHRLQSSWLNSATVTTVSLSFLSSIRAPMGARSNVFQ